MPIERPRTALGYHRQGFHIQPCQHCREWFCTVRYGAKYCSNACRQAAWRARRQARRRLQSMTFT